jgi:predicted ester cyclase
MRLVQAALPDFQNTVEESVVELDKVYARLTYRGELFGIPPTNRNITYAGAAFFTIFEGKISRGWVLGDALGVLRQLEGASSRHSEALNGFGARVSPRQ